MILTIVCYEIREIVNWSLRIQGIGLVSNWHFFFFFFLVCELHLCSNYVCKDVVFLSMMAKFKRGEVFPFIYHDLHLASLWKPYLSYLARWVIFYAQSYPGPCSLDNPLANIYHGLHEAIELQDSQEEPHVWRIIVEGKKQKKWGEILSLKNAQIAFNRSWMTCPRKAASWRWWFVPKVYIKGIDYSSDALCCVNTH